MPLSTKQKVLVASGVGLGVFAIVAYMNREQILVIGETVFDDTRKEAFAAALTAATPHGRTAQWADVIMQVATEQNVSPFLIAAIMERESQSGEALTPPGPGGTGDSGHGRGLMQLDDRVTTGKHGAAIADGSWADPYTNITIAVTEHLKPDLAFFQSKGVSGDALIADVIASYNAGTGNVWKRVQAGQPPDAATTGGNYGTDVLNRVASLTQAFQAAGGTSDSGSDTSTDNG